MDQGDEGGESGTYNDQDTEHGRKSSDVYASPPNKGEDAVTYQYTDHEARGDRDVDIKGLNLVKAGGFEEDHSIAGQWVAVQDL